MDASGSQVWMVDLDLAYWLTPSSKSSFLHFFIAKPFDPKKRL